MRHGDPDYVSEILPFDYTNYYAAEMGQSLVRRFVAFDRLIRPEELPAVKLETNALEGRLSEGGARRVNIDPGYVAKQHFILATGKGFSHRPYIGQGIYADLTLVYRKETYRPLEWTYPDYRCGADDRDAQRAAEAIYDSVKTGYRKGKRIKAKGQW